MSAMRRSCGVKLRRTDAVCVRFERRRDEQDYQAILEVAAKLPGKVVQEDEKLVMYYDVASMRLGE